MIAVERMGSFGKMVYFQRERDGGIVSFGHTGPHLLILPAR